MTPPGPTPDITLDDVMAVFRRREDPHAPLTATEVAAHLDCVRRTAYTKLQELAEQGTLSSKKTGARGRIWWIPADNAETTGVTMTPDAHQSSLTEKLLETSPMGIAVLDETGEIRRANARAEELLGLTRSAIEGRVYSEPAWDIYYRDGEPIPPAEHPVRQVIETGEPAIGLVHGITLPDGTERWLSSNSAPILDDQGDIQRIIVTLEDVTELEAQKQEIQYQRETLEYLDRVNEVIRGIDRAVVSAETRDEIEQAVCDHIATSDPYEFAVIGEFSSSYHEFTPHASSGAGEEYIDELCGESGAPSLSEGPGATAARTGDIQVAKQLSDLSNEFWQEAAERYGFRSFALVPVVYGDISYGILGVYADHPDAFDEEEQAILAELGETIGHAINAIERKQALLADTVVELEFRETGALADLFGRIAGQDDTTLEVERTVSLDDATVQYFTVSAVAADRFEAVLNGDSRVSSVRRIEADGETARFEVRSPEPTIGGVFARAGGRATCTEFSDDELRVIAEIPYGTDIRTIADAVQEEFPDMEFLARRSRERSTQTLAGIQETIAHELTARQHTALESAYYAGFFDWPRKSTGEQLAETMDIAPSTFHKHLRAGERKIFRLLLDPEQPS